MTPYWKSYSSNHGLIRLIESWKKSLHRKTFAGAALMGFLKAFDSLPQDLLIPKTHAYSSSKISVVFLQGKCKMKYCYPQNIKQEVINSEIDNKPSF